MALVHCDGFQLYDNLTRAQLLKKWSSQTASTTYPTASNGRWGAGSGAMVINNNGVGSNTKTLDTSIGTIIAGFAFQVPTGTSWVLNATTLTFFSLPGTNISLAATGNGATGTAAMIVRNNGVDLATIALPTTTWCYIEVKAVCSISVGSLEVRLDTVSRYSGSGLNTGAGPCSGFSFSAPSGGNFQYSIADLYVCDSSGTRNNDFLGDVRIETLYPDAEGTYTDFTLGAGASKTAAVNERLYDSDSSYVQSNTLNAQQSFTLADLATASGTVFAVHNIAVVRKESTPDRQVSPFLRLSTNDALGTAVQLPTGLYPYVMADQYAQVDPAGAAWTIANVNALQSGLKIVI